MKTDVKSSTVTHMTPRLLVCCTAGESHDLLSLLPGGTLCSLDLTFFAYHVNVLTLRR